MWGSKKKENNNNSQTFKFEIKLCVNCWVGFVEWKSEWSYWYEIQAKKIPLKRGPNFSQKYTKCFFCETHIGQHTILSLLASTEKGANSYIHLYFFCLLICRMASSSSSSFSYYGMPSCRQSKLWQSKCWQS